jgi:hypothetical protein
MPLEHYPQVGFELLDDRVPIWRFMKMKTFTRFIDSGSLYFCRADLFDDEHEGLPLEDYVRQVAAQMGPGTTFENTWENLKQDRQASYVSCWTLDESIHMWEKFAPQGVAVESDCGLLKAALNAMPARTMVGHVRYSLHQEGFNILRFITTKRPEYVPEKEVRALGWNMELSPRNPYLHDAPNGLTFAVDVKALVHTVTVSPQAPAGVFDEVQALLARHGYHGIPVLKSAFTGIDHLLPTADEIARYTAK